MGAIIKVKIKEGELSYEFDVAKDGEAFKRDLEREFKKAKDKVKRIVTIKKTEDVKLEYEKKYYDDYKEY